jgi:hypothetical protein
MNKHPYGLAIGPDRSKVPQGADCAHTKPERPYPITLHLEYSVPCRFVQVFFGPCAETENEVQKP